MYKYNKELGKTGQKKHTDEAQRQVRHRIHREDRWKTDKVKTGSRKQAEARKRRQIRVKEAKRLTDTWVTAAEFDKPGQWIVDSWI